MPKLRSKNYWEPTFEPLRLPINDICPWNSLQAIVGPFEKILKGEEFSNGNFHFLSEKIFRNIDFEGDFKRARQFTFKKCTFEKCHFSNTTWSNIKFSRCEFKNCTFGVVTFFGCYFIECKYDNISITGNQTKFIRTIIDPQKFINGAYTNLNSEQLAQHGTTPAYQLMRLELSKSKLAGNLARMLKKFGDRDLLAKSIRVKILQNIKYHRESSYYNMKTKNGLHSKLWNGFKYWSSFLESGFFLFLGSLNNWGTSFRRCAASGAGIISLFTLLYAVQSGKIPESIIQATEITFLAGLTKYTPLTQSIYSLSLMTFNMLVGVIWYGLLIPTVLEYFSKDE